MKFCVKFQTAINSSRKLKQNTRKRKEEKGFLDKSNLLKIPDCRTFSVLRKTLTGYRPYSHSVFEQKSPFISFFLCTVFVNKTKSNRFTLSLHCFYLQSCVFMVWSSLEVATISLHTIAWPPRIKTLPSSVLFSANTTLLLCRMPSDVEIFLFHS